MPLLPLTTRLWFSRRVQPTLCCYRITNRIPSQQPAISINFGNAWTRLDCRHRNTGLCASTKIHRQLRPRLTIPAFSSPSRCQPVRASSALTIQCSSSPHLSEFNAYFANPRHNVMVRKAMKQRCRFSSRATSPAWRLPLKVCSFAVSSMS